MLKNIILVGSLCIAILSGCGDTSRANAKENSSEQEQENQIINNGIHTLSLQSGDTKVFAFNMSEDGYVSIETDYYKCKIDLINSSGEIIKSTNGGNINPSINKGLYYIKVKSISDNCNSFVLFSPMIIDDNTNENRKIITNGTHRL